MYIIDIYYTILNIHHKIFKFKYHVKKIPYIELCWQLLINNYNRQNISL